MRAPLRSRPLDQADGLRRLFAGSGDRARTLPVVSNPHVPHGGVMLERLCSAFVDAGRRVLVVDAGELSPAPRDLAAVDLAACIEPLSPQVSYLAARGLAMRWIDTHGSTAAMLDDVTAAVPVADVLLVHAPAVDLVRLLGATSPWRHAGDGLSPARPVLLADDRPASVTHAYAAMKWLAQRGDFWVHDLLVAAARSSPRAAAIPKQIAGCADRFLGARVSHTAWVDPAASATAPLPVPLRALVAAQLGAAPPTDPNSAAALAMPVAALAPRRPPTAPSPRRTRHAHPEH